MSSLNHKSYESISMDQVARDLDSLIVSLDQKHRMQRKLQFLLDIRGYFIINGIQGAYTEYGLYRGEMMYAAWKILDRTQRLTRYVGYDTFEGEPKMTGQDQAANTFVAAGDYQSHFDETKSFLGKHLGDRLSLVVGDFRKPEVLKDSIRSGEPIALNVIDCNLLSSIEASLEYSLPKMAPGSVLFIDDYFINLKEGRHQVQEILDAALAKHRWVAREFQTYAPTARAFILTQDTGRTS